ncbi:hypothetical protein PUN28_018900 [Cardiocondyla obscurior]|uniref:Uncharacterized protein n=1 Tax=Cardiocondyla obscurior TaxID=286306 RepID=A0AAW2EGG3_9HYME
MPIFLPSRGLAAGQQSRREEKKIVYQSYRDSFPIFGWIASWNVKIATIRCWSADGMSGQPEEASCIFQDPEGLRGRTFRHDPIKIKSRFKKKRKKKSTVSSRLTFFRRKPKLNNKNYRYIYILIFTNSCKIFRVHLGEFDLSAISLS